MVRRQPKNVDQGFGDSAIFRQVTYQAANNGGQRLATRQAVRIAFLLLAVGLSLGAVKPAAAETRALKLYYLHTSERAEIVYKKNGKFLQDGLKKINYHLRDWRRNEPTKMDPKLLDLVWEIYRESGSRKYIHVVSGYRSPATNEMLRKRGRGVARKSQHTVGKALDFYLPDVNLTKLRRISLRKQDGGVGYYPRSGSPFVHVDTGGVRHWPRMTRKQLLAVFPNGKTLHVPDDRKPLAGYEKAAAEYKRERASEKIVIATSNDDDDEGDEPGLLARLFSGAGQRPPNRREQGFSAPKTQIRAANAAAGAPVPIAEVPVAANQEQAVPVAADLPIAPEAQDQAQQLLAALPSAVPAPVPAPRALVRQLSAPQQPLPAEETAAEAILTASLQVPAPTQRPAIINGPSELGLNGTAIERSQRHLGNQLALATLDPGQFFRPADDANLPNLSAYVGDDAPLTSALDLVNVSRAAGRAALPTSMVNTRALDRQSVHATLARKLLVQNAMLQSGDSSLLRNQGQDLQRLERPIVTASINRSQGRFFAIDATVGELSENMIINRLAEKSIQLQATQSSVAAASNAVAENDTVSGIRFKMQDIAALGRKALGVWTLSADRYATINNAMRAPTYDENVVRGAPSKILASGFSRSANAQLASAFLEAAAMPHPFRALSQ